MSWVSTPLVPRHESCVFCGGAAVIGEVVVLSAAPASRAL